MATIGAGLAGLGRGLAGGLAQRAARDRETRQRVQAMLASGQLSGEQLEAFAPRYGQLNEQDIPEILAAIGKQRRMQERQKRTMAFLDDVAGMAPKLSLEEIQGIVEPYLTEEYGPVREQAPEITGRVRGIEGLAKAGEEERAVRKEKAEAQKETAVLDKQIKELNLIDKKADIEWDKVHRAATTLEKAQKAAATVVKNWFTNKKQALNTLASSYTRIANANRNVTGDLTPLGKQAADKAAQFGAEYERITNMEAAIVPVQGTMLSDYFELCRKLNVPEFLLVPLASQYYNMLEAGETLTEQ